MKNLRNQKASMAIRISFQTSLTKTWFHGPMKFHHPHLAFSTIPWHQATWGFDETFLSTFDIVLVNENSNRHPTTDHYRFVHSPGVTHLSIVSIKRDDYKNDGWWHEHYILARSKIYCQKHKIIIIIHHHLSKNIERHHKSNNIYIVENGHPLPLSQTIPHYTQPQLVPSKRPVSRAVEKSPFYK